MIEAQISIQPPSQNRTARIGDILVVALPGFPWGRLDYEKTRVVVWQDDELEAALLARVQKGEVNPVFGLPYASRRTRGGITEIALRSRRLVDVESLPLQQPAGIPLTAYDEISASVFERIKWAASDLWNWWIG